MGLFEWLYPDLAKDPKGTKAVEEKEVVKQKSVSPITQKIIERYTNPTIASPFSGGSYPEVPISRQLFEEFAARKTPEMEDQYENIRKISGMVDAAPDPNDGQDYTIKGLMGLSDILSGTKYVPQLYQEKLGQRDKKLKERQMLAEIYANATPQQLKLMEQQTKNFGSMTKQQQDAFVAEQKLGMEALKLGEQGGTETIHAKEGDMSNKPKDGPSKKGGAGKKILKPAEIKDITTATKVPDRVDEMLSDFNSLVASKSKLERAGGLAGSFVGMETDVEKWEGRKKDFLAQLATARQKGVLSNQDVMFAEKELPTLKNSSKEAAEKLGRIKRRIANATSAYISNLSVNYDTSMFSSDMPTLNTLGRSDTRTYKGKTYQLKPGADKNKKENWIEVR